MKTFLFASLLAIAGVFAVANHKYAVNADWIYAKGTIGIICALALTAIFRRKSKGFDVVVASETIVAFGIFSLVIGLGVGILLAFANVNLNVQRLDVNLVRQIAHPFVEGIVTAAVAPILAIILRQFEAIDRASADDVTDPLATAADIADDFDALANGIRQSAAQINTMSNTIQASAVAYQNAAETMITALHQLGNKAAAETEPFGRALEQNTRELAALSSELTQHVDKARAAAGAHKDTADNLSTFSDAVKEGTNDLKVLSNVIENVDSIIKPSTKRSTKRKSTK